MRVMDNELNPVVVLAGLALAGLVLLVLYFWPTVLAYRRGHRNLVGVFTVNLCLGWTWLGWVGALVWAIYQERPHVPNIPPEPIKDNNPFGMR